MIVLSFQCASATDLKRILRAIEKEDYTRALELLDKDLGEFPVNPGSKLIYAKLLSTDTLPFYDLAGSRKLISSALEDLGKADPKTMEEFVKLGFSKSDIEETFADIRNQTYDQYSTQNSVIAYREFLELYTDAPQKETALGKIDSLAYIQTMEVNTWQDYEKYLTDYPNSIYTYEAKEKYDLLLFQERVASRLPSGITPVWPKLFSA